MNEATVTFEPFPEVQVFGVYRRRYVEIIRESDGFAEIRDCDSGQGDTVPADRITQRERLVDGEFIPA